MAVRIEHEGEDACLVNGKLVYRDSNNKWIAKEELTTAESKAFRTHLQAREQYSG